MRALLTAAFLAFATFCLPAWAQAPAEQQLTAEQQAHLKKLEALNATLKPITGVAPLPAAKASLNLGEDYYFLGAEDAKKVLVEGWGNPPSSAEDVLGMIFPKGKTFMDPTWGAVVSFEETFYVSDADAESADYDELVRQMQAGEAEVNAAREKEGFEPLHLVGWAQPPSYDKTRHHLIWAQEIAFGTEPQHTLNYDVRHLGRYGVLSINIVDSMANLAQVREAAAALADTAQFDAGSRYADYREGDKKAGYGLAGLVAAGVGLGVAKKAGLLAVVLAFAKKGFVLIIAAFGAIAAVARKMFKSKEV